MPKQDDFVIVSEEERITTSIDGYFRTNAIVAKFDDTTLNTGKTFDASGVEVYTSLDGIMDKFPTTHAVYKWAKGQFDQKSNTGVNKSSLESLAIIQQKTSDASIEACLNRIGYVDGYRYEVLSTDKDNIVSLNSWIGSRKKLAYHQTKDVNVKTSVTEDVASVLKNATAKRSAIFYHSTDDENLAGSIASIMASANIGDRSAMFKKPMNITVDTFTQPEEVILNGKSVNYYTPFSGQAGTVMANNLTVNGVTCTGDDIQKIEQLDRIELTLQNTGMNVLISDVPFDDRGGTILLNALEADLRQFQKEEIISIDSKDDDGNILKGYTIDVLRCSQIKKDYPSRYAKKQFVVFITLTLAGTAKAIYLNLVY